MKTSHKTLVIRFSSIGDIVLSTPLLRVLRARFPQGQIDYVTRSEYAQLVRFNANLNVTHEFDTTTGFAGLRELKKKLRRERYDLIVDLHNSIRSRFLRSMRGVGSVVKVDKRIKERTLLVKFKKNTYESIVPVADRYIETVLGFGVQSDGKKAEVHIPDEILFGVSGKMAKLRLDRFEHVIGFCPFARHTTKEWPAERFVELGARVAGELNGAIMIFGGTPDRERAERMVHALSDSAGKERILNLTGELSLLESAAAMQYCDVIVTNDSGLMHLAAAMEKKVVALFGSTVEEFGFFPPKENSVVLERKGLHCRPCSHLGLPQCPEGHFRCMSEITVEDVFQAVVGFIRQ